MAKKNKSANKAEAKNIDQAELQKLEEEGAEAKGVDLEEAISLLSDDLKELLSEDISEAEKNEKKRSSEIIGIFAAHNYFANGLTPKELKTTMEDLGPTYVKIGQILSSRVDVLPQEYCDELATLRANVKELDPKVARAVIEQETGKKIEDIYSEFRDKPLGSASVGQAHYAKLKDGTEVVTKVQRPLIAGMMTSDFALLKKLAGVANVFLGSEEASSLDLLTFIEEMEKVTYEELDFRIEAKNTKEFKERCIEDETKITCPTVIDELTTERIFTMTFVDGDSLAKKNKIEEEGYDLNEIGRVIMENYVHQIMDVGMFHADPHQGNIMVAHGVPYWIDFGMIGRVEKKDIDFIQSIVSSVLKGNAEELVNSLMSIGATSQKTNKQRLIEEADEILNKYTNVTSVDDIDMTDLLDEVPDLADRYYIEMPGRFTMLARSLITIEGVLEDVCPTVNLFELLSQKLMQRAKENFDLKQELLKWGQGLVDVGEKTVRIPALIADLLSCVNKGNLKLTFNVPELVDPIEAAGDFVKYITLIVIACVLFIGSCVLCMTDIKPVTANGVPLFAAAGICFSIALGIFAVKRLWKR